MPLTFVPVSRDGTELARVNGPTSRFQAHAPGMAFFFETGAVQLLPSVNPPSPGSIAGVSEIGTAYTAAVAEQPRGVTLRFLGTAPTTRLHGRTQLQGKVSYLLGNDPGGWSTNLPTFSSITYSGLYKGTNLTYAWEGNRLKGTYTLSRGANPGVIRWRYEDAQSVALDGSGSLVITLHATCGETMPARLTEAAPVAWQDIEGTRLPVEVRYEVAPDGSISFSVGAYDRRYTLLIDPTLDYSTYLGGSASDAGTWIATDTKGNIYVTGITGSTNFPTRNARQPQNAGGLDAFVVKMNAAGTDIIYSTYLGGAGNDEGWAIAIDDAGSAYLTGHTTSLDFPVTNPYQATNGGARDVFVSRLSPDGSSLIYSTYLGGSSTDEGAGIALDAEGGIYVAGDTTSADFPLAHPYQSSLRGTSDAFMTRLSANGSSLTYSTYMGGSGSDQVRWSLADAAGNAYITGTSGSTDYPTANAYQPTNRGGQDAYITKLSPTGDALVYSTYLGGNGPDAGWAMTLGANGHAYLTGFTGSTDFPAVNAVQPANRGGTDAFVTQFTADGSSLVYSTYLGGNGSYDGGYGIAVDRQGNAFATGLTSSTDFPVVNAIQPASGGGEDVFVSAIGATGTAFLYSSYMGGLGVDYGYGIVLNGNGDATLTGQSNSANFPTANAYQPVHGGNFDAIIVKISLPCVASFTDVPESSPFYNAVRCLACRNIITGYDDGTFRPDSHITRGQLAKIVSNAAGFTESAGVQIFTDVPGTQPFYPWINRLSRRGYISGYACGGPGEPCQPGNSPYFRPSASATRGQTSKIVSSAAGINDPVSGQRFEDVGSGHPFYLWIERLGSRNVMSGYACGASGEPCGPGRRAYFRPGNPVTRGQTSKIVANTFYPDCQALKSTTGWGYSPPLK